MQFRKEIKGVVKFSNLPQIPVGPITLLKYDKIGGHTIIYKYDQYLIKINDEHQIYERILKDYPELGAFIPKYYGLIKMEVPGLNVVQPNKEIEPLVEFIERETDMDHALDEKVDTSETVDFNPASGVDETNEHKEERDKAKQQMADLERAKKRIKQNNKREAFSLEKEYIIMEDLTHDLVNPFIIDLKLGTRQYGINSPPVKVESQKRKCATSTSRTLGVRLCGLQMWQDGKPTILDKYYGRLLNKQEFLDDLIRFFRVDNDGNDTDNNALIRCLLLMNRILKLYVAVEKLDYFRFYGSSVLLAYDGASKQNTGIDNQMNNLTLDGQSKTNYSIKDFEAKYNFKIRLIDFSKTVLGKEPNVTSKDYGFLKGLFNLFNFLKLIIESCGLQLNIMLPQCPKEGQECVNNAKHEINRLIGEIQSNKFKIPPVKVHNFEYEYDELVSE